MIKITYTTEIVKPYCDEINACKTHDELKRVVKEWKELAYDAYEQVFRPEFSWDEYQKGVRKEKRGIYSGDKWAFAYGAILLPAVLMYIGLVAQRYHAPEGTVFIRLRDLGPIINVEEADGFHYVLDMDKVNGKKAKRGRPMVYKR